MIRSVAAGLIVVCTLVAQPLPLAACGDKFLVASRGTRFQRAGLVRRPASLLVYAAPGRFAAVLDQLRVVDALRQVGYAPTTVSDRTAFERALRDQRFDLVLIDLVDSTLPAPAAAGPRPAVVVVAFDATRATMAAARRTHDSVIKAPGRARTVVDAVDDALFARALRPSSGTRASN